MDRRILVLLDGSPAAEAALPHALTRARDESAQLCLLQVVCPRLPIPLIRSRRKHERAAWLYLDTVSRRLQMQGVGVTCRVRRGLIGAVLAEAAQADLLFVATRSARLLSRLLGRTVPKSCLLCIPCLVVVVRPESDSPSGLVRSFTDDARPHAALAQRPLGRRSVPLDRIVGSVGRARDLRSDFMPVQKPVGYERGDTRYRSIYTAMEEGTLLPPIELYKLGERYYVLDGNHRVAAARALGFPDIDACVLEFLPVQDADAHRVFAERRDFEQATGLSGLDATRPGHFRQLQTMLREYAQSEGLDLPAAAGRWYARVYLPLAGSLETVRLDNLFPGERTADLFVHLAALRAAEEEFLGHPISWDEALQTMLIRYRSCRHHARIRLPELRRLIGAL